MLYLILRTQGIHPLEPDGLTSAPWDVVVQHDVVVRHEHELAVLRRRDDAVVLHPDGRPGGAELRLGRGRHRRRSIAVIRGVAARVRHATLGNFCVDLTRTLLYVLLPISIVVGARPASSQGVQTLPVAPTARGPVASQEAIKQLGTNGGGFFNVNSALPFENPTGSRTSSRCC